MTTPATADATTGIAEANTKPDSENGGKSKKPLATADYGVIKLALFDREVRLTDDKTFTAYNISLRRGYKQNGEWKEQKLSLDLDDVKQIELGLDEMVRAAYAAKRAAR